MPYGERTGERLNKIGHGKVTPQKQKKKVDPEKVVKRVYEMIIESYTPQQIATKLKVNPTIIKDHFKAEGLV
ncbi:hypothetical protein [Bacillus toyonensis]|uniref:hypothetical protein n=1 Tax=Bacillus toyonensis TaxID=155322 RepID=UPI001E49B348|nr:hypothetical protein [Bacillus toyonensis]MEC2348775.1 hypothetical protein [Bacillus toyonensis]MED3185044.1 hypothetical protein [Bacillus toyonensis]